VNDLIGKHDHVGPQLFHGMCYCREGINEKSCLTFKIRQLFSLFDGVIPDVAKTLPNAGFAFQKPSIYAGFRRYAIIPTRSWKP